MFKAISRNAGLKVTIYEVIEVRNEKGEVVGSLKRTERMSPDTLERKTAQGVSDYFQQMRDETDKYNGTRTIFSLE